MLPTCRELGVTLVAYSPLGRGFLTGTIVGPKSLEQGDTRSVAPRMTGDNLAHNRALVARLEDLARGKGCTPAQLALAWVLSRGETVVPIPGTKRRTYLEQNVAAAALPLTQADTDALDAAFPPGCTAGERYAPQAMRAIDA